jgi:hypothetical protein
VIDVHPSERGWALSELFRLLPMNSKPASITVEVDPMKFFDLQIIPVSPLIKQ